MAQEGRNRVLIVENNDTVRTSLTRLLHGAGFDNEATWSGHEALRLLNSREFDGLLTDDYLPDLHSADFLERIGRLPVPVWIVVMKGAPPSRDDVSRFRSLGVSAIVDKRDVAQVLRAVSTCSAGAKPSLPN